MNGFLVSSVEEAAERIVQLVSNPDLAAEMGKAARERVREKFLLTRLVEEYLDLIAAFEANFTLREGFVTR